MPFAAPNGGGSFWVVGSEAACLTSCTLGSELLMWIRLPVLHPLPQLTHSSAHLCFPSSSGRQKLHLHPSFSGGLDSEEKLPAFLFIVALHQVLSSLCTFALSLLLFLPTRNTERVLCFLVELSPNLAHCGLDKMCQIFSCCRSPPMKTRWPLLALGKAAH